MASRRELVRMSDDEIDAFLHERQSMSVATFNHDDTIHLVAMWYAMVDGDAVFWTFGKSQKILNLQRDPRITCLVEDGTVYEDLRGAAIEGRAEVTDDADLLWRIGVDIWERYYGPYDESLRPIVETMLNKRVAVRVKAERIRSWDHRKLGMGSTGEPAGTTVTVPGRRAR